MNDHKIAFILCVNNMDEYAECKRYLDRLIVPKGYQKDIITIQDAPSMCAGYNAGMQCIDAKYKVYMHQDTYIINKNFIQNMLDVFKDSDVGLMGVVGARKLDVSFYGFDMWDTGKIYYNHMPKMINGYENRNGMHTEVELVDGLLMATQYDIEFREDLLTGFYFYNVSACFEYRRAGYKVVVPKQSECWVYHNDRFHERIDFDTYRNKIIDEYGSEFGLDPSLKNKSDREYEEAKLESKRIFEKLIDLGQMDAVSELLIGEKIDYFCVGDIYLLSTIYMNEIKESAFEWTEGVKRLYAILDEVKWFVKRVEYDVNMSEQEYKYFCSTYSARSIAYVVVSYCVKKKYVTKRLRKYISDRDFVEGIANTLKYGDESFETLAEEKNITFFNMKNIDKKRNILLQVGAFENQEAVEALYEVVKRFSLENKVIVFAGEDNVKRELFSERNIPVVIGAEGGLDFLMQEKNWNIDTVIYTNKRMKDEYRRVFAGSSIKLINIKEYITQFMDGEDWRLYYTMGRILESENVRQAYLCYKQAEYYCIKDEELEVIRKRLSNVGDVNIPSASIVILSYNTMEKTRNCIESIYKNTNADDYEIVVIDNASTDGSVEYLKGCNGIKLLLNEENKGFAGGCNQGIRMAEKNNDIWLLNSDTLIAKNALFWLRMGLYEEENTGACGSVSNYSPNYQNINENHVRDIDYETVAKKYNVYKSNAIEEKNWLVGFSMLIKREALEKSGYLDEQFFPGNFEDNDLSYRLLEKGYKLKVCHNSFVFHYGNSSFNKTDKQAASLLENKQKFIDKWKFDPEEYTVIKYRHIEIIDKNPDAQFNVMDMDAGVGATISRVKSLYQSAYVAGKEICEEAAKIASFNGCDINNDKETYFDYVFVDRISTDKLKEAMQSIKNNGKIVGSQENSYYNELIGGNEKGTLNANEIIDCINSVGLKIVDFTYEKGFCQDEVRLKELCEKYKCDEKLVLAKKFYFVVKKV